MLSSENHYEDKLLKLLRKLSLNEKVLENLISNDFSRCSRIVELKLSQFEELISDIPSGRDDLANFYNGKVTTLWTNYVSGQYLNGPRSSPCQITTTFASKSEIGLAKIGSSPSISHFSLTESGLLKHSLESNSRLLPRDLLSDDTSTSISSAFFSDSHQNRCLSIQISQFNSSFIYAQENNLFSLSPSKRSIWKEKPSNSLSIRECLKFAENLTKTHYYFQLEQTFDRMPRIERCNDIDSLKELLVLIAQASALSMQHSMDARLALDLFSAAFPKLPSELQTLFIGEKQQPKLTSICALHLFLAQQMENSLVKQTNSTVISSK